MEFRRSDRSPTQTGVFPALFDKLPRTKFLNLTGRLLEKTVVFIKFAAACVLRNIFRNFVAQIRKVCNKWHIHSDADLDYGAVFQYNKKLKLISISCDADLLSVLDLSRFQELEEVHLSDRFGTVLLPKQIQYVSLYYCQKLKCYAVTPPELDSYNTISTVYVPKEQVAVYKATEPWKRFNIQPL